jgi:hypothetical protein
MEVGLREVCGLRILLRSLFVGYYVFVLDGLRLVLAGVLLDSNEGIVLFLLFDAPHVLVEIVVDILVAVTGVECFQEELMVIFPRKLL